MGTRATSFSPEASRDQVTPSESNTPSRTPNASVTPTNTPTGTSTPTGTQTPTNSAIPSSLTKSPYIPSQSPSITPLVVRSPFVQQGTSTLVELVLPCNKDVCTFAEAQFYLTEVAFALDIPESDVRLQSIFGNEITFLVCGTTGTADLLNAINNGNTVGFENVEAESANFDVTCEQGDFILYTSSGASVLIASLLLVILVL